MANNCLVTRFKGVVNNPNLKKLGEVKINLLTSDGTANWNNVLEINLSDTVQYEFGGNVTGIKLVNSSLVEQSTLPSTGELTSGRKYIIWTGDGYVKIRKKYKFRSLVVRKNMEVDDIEEYKVSSMPDGFAMQWDSGDQLFEVLSSPVAFMVNSSNHRLSIPIIKTLNFGNIVVTSADENTILRFDHYTDAGYNYNLQGDIANITSLGINIERISLKDIGASKNFYISDISALSALCANTCTDLVLVGSNADLNDQNPSELATWKALNSVNLRTRNTEFEWKAVFDAWNAMSEYRGKTVTIYVTGTYNGNDIFNLHHVVFDSSSSYTVTA